SHASRSRLGVPLATFVLAALLVAGSVTTALGASSTRKVYFGSPPPGGAQGTLAQLFDVTGGSLTAFDVTVQNVDNQTLNHVTVLGGKLADQTFNSNFPQPSGTSLPAGATFAAGYPAAPAGQSPPNGTCAVRKVIADGDSIECPVGQLSAGSAAVTFRIVVRAPAATGAYPWWMEVDLNEGASTTGSNQDSFYATGSIAVGDAATTCTTSSYFLTTQAVSLSSPGSCAQPTSIAGPTFPVKGAFAQVGTTSTAANYCPPTYKCFGLLSSANVNGGNGGPVVWTISWLEKPKGVIHFRDGYDPVTNPTAFDNIPFKGSTKCPTPTPADVNCWFSVTTSGHITTAVFQTPLNGGSKGY
ncbi:MAG TPA: hypothetical protein VIV06_11835, partial [Candidatus Limnocylindrales bacterium]